MGLIQFQIIFVTFCCVLQSVHLLAQVKKIPVKNLAGQNTAKFGQQNKTVRERCVIPGVIAITFDDGPHYRTYEVLKVLRQHNVTATFFINGDNYMDIENENATAIVQTTLDAGHQVESHTWSHPDLTANQTFEFIEYEMNHLSDKFLELFGKRPFVMRPPYGEVNDTVINIIGSQLGYEIVMWSIDTWDWQHPGDHEASLQEYYQNINGTDPSKTLGFIALHHDTLRYGHELANISITYGKSMGYRYVSLNECLGIAVS